MSLTVNPHSLLDIAELPEEEERFLKVCELIKARVSLGRFDLEAVQLTAEHRFITAKQFVQLNPYYHSLNLGQFRLSASQYFDIVVHLVDLTSRWEDLPAWRHFPLTQEQRLTITIKLAKKFPNEIVAGLNNENDPFNDLQRKQIYLAAARTDLSAMMHCPKEVRICNTAFCSKNATLRSVARKKIDPKLLMAIEKYLALKTGDLVGMPGAEDLVYAERKKICAYVDFWMLGLTSEEVSWIAERGFLDDICVLVDDLVPGLIIATEEIAHIKDLFMSLEDKPFPYQALLKFPLTRLVAGGMNPELINAVIGHLAGQREKLKDEKNFALIYEALNRLSTNPQLRNAQKESLLQELIREPALFTGNLRNLRILLDCDTDVLSRVPSEEPIDLPSLAFTAFQELFSGIDLRDYQTAFASCRVPEALMVYGARLNNLNGLMREKGLESFAIHIRSLLDGTYQEKRYDIASNAQLARIANYDPSLIKKWSDNWSHSLSLSDEELPVNEQIFTWLQEEIEDTQFISNLDAYPYLRDFIQGSMPDALERLNAVKQASTFKALSLAEQMNIVLQSKFCRLATCSSKEATLGLLKELMQDKWIRQMPLFQPALEKKMREIELEIWASRMTIVSTDDPEDLRLIGNEGMVSCQNYEGNPNHNIGLLGYLQNGQTKLLAVKNEQGKIVARSIVRLLWDGERPVIFVEGIYTHLKGTFYKQSKRAIYKMAHHLGSVMSSPVTSFQGKGPHHPKILGSLPGVAPYECIDSAEGVTPNGAFELERFPRQLGFA